MTGLRGIVAACCEFAAAEDTVIDFSRANPWEPVSVYYSWVRRLALAPVSDGLASVIPVAHHNIFCVFPSHETEMS